MYKLEHFIEKEWVEYSHLPAFHLSISETSAQRIVAGVPGSDPAVFLRLARCMCAPLIVLYVLHTARGEGKPGRYQSPELSFEEVEKFITEFERFLRADARFDLWLYSPTGNEMLVWDRHDLLYAYGPLARYSAELEDMGFEPGDPVIPSPHTHNYHAELDPLARQLMGRFEWRYSPLRPEDEQ